MRGHWSHVYHIIACNWDKQENGNSKSRNNIREITPRSSFEGKCEVALVSQEAVFQMTTEDDTVDYWDLVEYYSNRSQAVFMFTYTRTYTNS